MKEISASKTTRAELLKWAQDFLQSRGAAGFSFQDLADRLKIRKASIHYHFRTKNELFKSLIAEYRSSFQEWAKSVESLPASGKWHGYADLFRSMTKDRRKVCPGGAMGVEIMAFPASVRQSFCEFQIEQRQWLEKMIQQGQDEGFFKDGLPPRTTAILIGSAIQGSLQIAKLHDSPVVFEKVMAELEELLRGKVS